MVKSMKKLINSLKEKIIAVILSACILAQSNSALFAQAIQAENYQPEIYEFSLDNISREDMFNLSEKLNQAYERGESDNPYENALLLLAETEINKVKNSAQAKALSAAKQKGKSSYGNMWPAYLYTSQAKNVSYLEGSLQSLLAFFVQEPAIMDFTAFNKQYSAYIAELAKESAVNVKVPYNADPKALREELLSAYPAKTVYAEYVKEAQAEIAWRKANKDKVEQTAYDITRAYIDIVSAEVFSFETIALLKDLEFNGKKVLTETERKAIYSYNITRLEKQKLEAFELNILSNKSKKKIASALAKDLTERILIAAVFAQDNDTRFLSAVENLIYKSEEGLAFSNILAIGFSALLAKNGYSNIENILSKYQKEEGVGASFWEKINLSYWTEKIEQKDGTFLGKLSQKTEYALTHSYGNVFTDIAKLLSQEGSSRSLGILYRYGIGSKNPVKPFLAGALLSKRTGAKEYKSAQTALALANINFGDLNDIQEFDLDNGLALRYQSIKNDLGKYAITNKAKKTEKAARKTNFAYLQRAAFAGDIALALWGCAGLIKLGGKTISLSKSAYSAVKASKISTKAARIGFIKANYKALTPYISAKRSFLRAGLKIRAGVGLKNDAVKVAKLQKDLRTKNIATLAKSKEAAALKAAQTGSAKDAAKAETIAKSYETAVLQDKFITQNKLYGASYELKRTSYLDKVRSWRAGTSSQVPQPPVFTKGEQNYIALAEQFRTSLANLQTAKNNYNALKWYNKNIINPLKTWWNKPASGYGLGIAELETGEGITIAQALRLKGTYTPPALSSAPAAVKPLNRAAKVYNWLDNHNLGFAANTLRFVNNKATLLGATLLFNYNVATVTPGMINGGRVLAATEQVSTISKAQNGLKIFSLSANDIAKTTGLALNNIKPAAVVDPKIFSIYNTLPLIGGNILQGRGAAYWLSQLGNAAKIGAGTIALPAMLLRDVYSYADGRLLNPAAYTTPPLRPANYFYANPAQSAFTGFGNPASWIYEKPAVPSFSAGALGLTAEEVLSPLAAKAQPLEGAKAAVSPLSAFVDRITGLIGGKTSKISGSPFIYNFLSATTITAMAPMISNIYGLDNSLTNNIISVLSYLPAISVPFMGYFFGRHGVSTMAKTASLGTLAGVGLTILGGLNGFTASASPLALITTLAGISLISISNEIKYSAIFPLIDANFDAQKALSLTTNTLMARSAGTIFFLEFGPLLNWASQSLGFGDINSTITFPLLLLPISALAAGSMLKSDFKEVPVEKSKPTEALINLINLFKTDKTVRRSALTFALIEAGELTASLLLFSLAQEHYGALSDMPNILGGVLIYAAMALARTVCGELQKRGLTSKNTYKASAALVVSGLTLFGLKGISPLGLTGAAMFFIGDANLFPPLLNETLKGRSSQAANISLLLFSLSTLAAGGGWVLSFVTDITGSLQAAILVPAAFSGTALALASRLFRQKKADPQENLAEAHALVYAGGEKKAPAADEAAIKKEQKPQAESDKGTSAK